MFPPIWHHWFYQQKIALESNHPKKKLNRCFDLSDPKHDMNGSTIQSMALFDRAASNM